MPRHTTAVAAAVVAALLAALLAACADSGGDGHGHVARSDLEAASYRSENAADGVAELEDGEYEEPVAPGSSSMTSIVLGKSAFGDLDGDGEDDAAAITIEQPGGSGTFSYVHALPWADGALTDAGAVFLGDRVRVEGVSIHDGVIVVAMLDRPEDASFSEAPTLPVIRRFRIEGGALTELEPAGAAAY